MGIELEFHGLSPKITADLVANCLKGKVHKEHDDLYKIETKWGEFEAETDQRLLKKLSAKSEKNKSEDSFDEQGLVRKALKGLSDEIIP